MHIDKQTVSNMMIIAQSAPSTALKSLSTLLMAKAPICPASVGNTSLEPKAQKALNLALAIFCPPLALGAAIGTIINKCLEKKEAKNNEKMEKQQDEKAANADITNFVLSGQNEMANTLEEYKRGMEELKRGNGPDKAPEKPVSNKTQESVPQQENGLDYEALFQNSESTLETPNFQLSDEYELGPELEKGFTELDDFDTLLNDITASHNEEVQTDDIKEEKKFETSNFSNQQEVYEPFENIDFDSLLSDMSASPNEVIEQEDKKQDPLVNDEKKFETSSNVQLNDKHEAYKDFENINLDSLLSDMNASLREGIISEDSKKQNIEVKENTKSTANEVSPTPTENKMVWEKSSNAIKGNFNKVAIPLLDRDENPETFNFRGKDYCAWSTTQNNSAQDFVSIIYIQGMTEHGNNSKMDLTKIILNIDGEVLVAKKDGREVDPKELKVILKNLAEKLS